MSHASAETLAVPRPKLQDAEVNVLQCFVICLTGRGYDGTEKYHLYDWLVDPDAPDFINKPSNSMTDTRGYWCAIGADGKLYAAFECAGSNHIFRYEPRLVNGVWVEAKDKKGKGDAYHAFHNSRAEHKTFIARFDPATGADLHGQEFTARLPNGRANAVRAKNSTAAGGPDGSLCVGGTAAAKLPVSSLPPSTGDYKGGGFLLGLKPTMDARLFCLRLQLGTETHAADARLIGGKTIVVCAGSTSGKPGRCGPRTRFKPRYCGRIDASRSLPPIE